MRNFIIGLIFWISPSLAMAHNPLSAKYTLESGENASVLTVSLSQDGVNQVLVNKYGKAEINKVEQKQFKELIVYYIKQNFHLSIDDKTIELKKGGIKLGSHQTDLKFVLPPLPKDLESFHIDIPAFKENDQHQTIFYYNLFGNVEKVILGQKNNYQATLRMGDGTSSNNWLWMGLAGLVVMTSILFMVFKKK